MVLEKICPPVILYLGFSLIQIVIDIFKNLYNTAFLKFLVMIIFSVILNILCNLHLTVISWILVFIPFISMTFITGLLLFVFGLSPDQGTVNYKLENNILVPISTDISNIETAATKALISGSQTCNSFTDIENCTQNACVWQILGSSMNMGKCITPLFDSSESAFKPILQEESQPAQEIIVPDIPSLPYIPSSSSEKIIRNNELCYFNCVNPSLENNSILNIQPDIEKCQNMCNQRA